MDNQALKEHLSSHQSQPDATWQPRLFFMDRESDQADLEQLLNDTPPAEILDSLDESVEDLFKITFPYIAPGSPEYAATFNQFQERYYGGRETWQTGVWGWYPWRRVLTHLPASEDYLTLRTARNKFLITAEEQARFYGARIGVAGLSVGSSAASTLVLSGGGGRLRLADYDTLAITNLNRLLGSVADLGRAKIVMNARRLCEINPYQELDLFPDGVTPENTSRFIGEGDSRLDLLIEEVDDIKTKIDLRFAARAAKVPVLMATDNGDNAFLDIERFDLEPDRPLFHGLVPEEVLSKVPAKPNLAERVRLAGTIVGADITPRTQQSLMQVGSRLPSWPQLGNAATLSGVLISYAARRVVCGQELPSGRYYFSIDELLDPAFGSQEAVAERAREKEIFLTGFNLLYGKEAA